MGTRSRTLPPLAPLRVSPRRGGAWCGGPPRSRPPLRGSLGTPTTCGVLPGLTLTLWAYSAVSSLVSLARRAGRHTAPRPPQDRCPTVRRPARSRRTRRFSPPWPTSASYAAGHATSKNARLFDPILGNSWGKQTAHQNSEWHDAAIYLILIGKRW